MFMSMFISLSYLTISYLVVSYLVVSYPIYLSIYLSLSIYLFIH